jgi:hypothetical protein
MTTTSLGCQHFPCRIWKSSVAYRDSLARTEGNLRAGQSVRAVCEWDQWAQRRLSVAASRDTLGAEAARATER